MRNKLHWEKRTKLNTISRRYRWHKNIREEAYRFLMPFGINDLCIKLANNFRFSPHWRCLCDFFHFVFNNSLCSSFLSVILCQTSNLNRQTWLLQIPEDLERCIYSTACTYIWIRKYLYISSIYLFLINTKVLLLFVSVTYFESVGKNVL